MEPIKFDGVNVVYGENQPEYMPLPAHRNDNGDVMTCWKLTDEEIQQVVKNGCIWVGQLTFNQPLQPMRVSATRWDNENQKD